MRRATLAAIATVAALAGVVAGRPDRAEPVPRQRVVLVVAEARGYVHESIPDAVAFYRRLGARDPRIRVAVLERAADLTPARLRGADGVVFASTTGELPLDLPALLAFVRDGGAFVGTHSASNTFDRRPSFGRMLGAQFKSHPPVQAGSLRVADRRHPATRGLPARYRTTDEFYEFRSSPRRRARVLVRADPASIQGEQGRDLPLVWCRPHGRGRVFYSALGHPDSAWRPGRNTTLIAGGLRWALGLARGACGVPAVR